MSLLVPATSLTSLSGTGRLPLQLRKMKMVSEGSGGRRQERVPAADRNTGGRDKGGRCLGASSQVERLK